MTTKEEAKWEVAKELLNRHWPMDKLSALRLLNGKVTEEHYDKYKNINKIKELEEEILNKFRSPNLLEKINEELSKDHLEDDNLKMTVFLGGISALQKNHRKRISIAITGDTSVGKDNLFKTILKHMPKGTTIFLTKATQSTLEDDVKDRRIICYSEVNKHRDDGANKDLVEAIKQIAEGGMSSLKKDMRTGMKTARHEEDEQKTVFYGTTEEQRDEELETRFLCAGMKYTYSRGKKVSESVLDTLSNLSELIKSNIKQDSWIKKGLNYFYFSKEVYDEIWIPYAELLKNINGKPAFDYKDARSQRDVKRLMALTSSITWLYQEQRKSFNTGQENILIAEPEDFINAIKISQGFFNETYTGIDERNLEIIKSMKRYCLKNLKEDVEKWVPRDYIEKDLMKAKNTIKRRMHILSEKGLVEGIKGYELNRIYGNPEMRQFPYDNNKIYYKRCQKGIKKVLIRCQLLEIEQKLNEFSTDTLTPFGYTFDTLFTQGRAEKGKIYTEKCKGVNSTPPMLKTTKKGKIDTFELTPLKNKTERRNSRK
jgi:hypothetical protein